MSSFRGTSLMTFACLLALAAAGCDAGDEQEGAPADAARGGAPRQPVGQGEGRLELLAWPGYVENGSSDPDVDWVSGFESRTGCRVRVTLADSSDEMLRLMRTRDFDGVSASGDVTGRLIRAGLVAPVNTDLIPNYADVFQGLKDRPHNSVGGQMYGVPQGRVANLLMWRTDEVAPAPGSWSVVWDEGSPYAGRIAAYDSPMYIADAALYLKATEPDLGIENVYELDDRQFRAAVELLARQHEIVGEYWSDYTTEQAAFVARRWVVGTSWQFVAEALRADEVPVDTVLPREGATGWSDTWMISSTARHPHCMYRWFDHVLSPEVNAAAAEWLGQAPSNRKSCALTADADHCATYHAADEAYFSRVAYWTTPQRECGDSRGSVCRDYEAWAEAWAEIEG